MPLRGLMQRRGLRRLKKRVDGKSKLHRLRG